MKSILLKLLIILPAGIFTGNEAFSQETFITIGTQIPLQYDAGIEFGFSEKWGASLHAGILTKPYSEVILDVLEYFGTSGTLTNTIGDAFTYGAILQPAVQWSWSKNYYTSLYGQLCFLNAKDAPKEAIENYYGVSLDSYPSRRNQSTQVSNDLELTSNLYNLGLLIGRRFHFKDSRFQLRTEIAISKVLGSRSKISSDYRDLANLSISIDEELEDYYWEYGYLPTLNLYLAYRLN